MPGLVKNPIERSGDEPDKVKVKKGKTILLEAKNKVIKKKKFPTVSYQTRAKKIPSKENSKAIEEKPVEVRAKTEKKVPMKNKRKEKDPSTSNSPATEVLNGSLSEKKTGDLYLGFHASSAGGVHNAIRDSVSVGAQCLALFLRPQRTWTAPPLKPEAIEQFKKLREEEKLLPNMILPHGSYLLNLGSPDPVQRAKSLELLVDDLERCQELGILLYNFHPGSSCGKISRSECIGNIADGINMAHQRTAGSEVRVVLENMSCQGHTIGGDLRELGQIIELVEDKKRLGVCLDTCHAMAAGYDLSSEEGFDRLIREFAQLVGWQWLMACHINDSLGPAGCHRDRHQNIGQGTIGLEGFRRIVNCQHFTDIPLILETPLSKENGINGYRTEIQVLMSLRDKKKE